MVDNQVIFGLLTLWNGLAFEISGYAYVTVHCTSDPDLISRSIQYHTHPTLLY
jgi:hypothetical protein